MVCDRAFSRRLLTEASRCLRQWSSLAIALFNRRLTIIIKPNDAAVVLLVSSALEEIQALSDRILVFYEGEIVKEFARGEADEKRLGKYMGGAHD